MKGYTTYGKVRGQSGKLHRTKEAAEKDRQKDGRNCAKQGGYTDRFVCLVDDDNYLRIENDNGLIDYYVGHPGKGIKFCRRGI